MLASVALTYNRSEKEYEKRNHCVSNLIHIRTAKIDFTLATDAVDGVPITWNEINMYVSGRGLPIVCQNGGTYELGGIGERPRCSYTNAVVTYRLEGLVLKRYESFHAFGAD